MYLKRLEISGFKSFAHKSIFEFNAPISAVVGPNGSGKSNIVEAMRFVLGEQSLKSLRGKRGEDLIFNGSKTTGRLNHAKVSLLFDNSKREFNIDYDEVEIARSVYRDSSHQYFINGSQVRLKDIIELLASVNIGASGHHIISQGEADRVLNASIKERRAMIEDALGLKVYQWKIQESTKKLEKTRENIKQVESLRREIAPHMRFLKKQVEKVQQAEEMRKDLAERYREYLKREELYIQHGKESIEKERSGPEHELTDLNEEIRVLEESLAQEEKKDHRMDEISRMESSLRELRAKKDELSRSIGRVEGMIEYETMRREEKKHSQEDTSQKQVPFAEVDSFIKELEGHISKAEDRGDVSEIKHVLSEIRSFISGFLVSLSSASHVSEPEEANEDILKKFEEEKRGFQEEWSHVASREQELLAELSHLKSEVDKEKDSMRDAEKKLFELKTRQNELLSILDVLASRKERITKIEQDFQEEIREGIVLVGRAVSEYEGFWISTEEVVREAREEQEKRRKEIEKIKIRLEDLGGGSGEEVLKEYNEVVERDAFLEKELTDLFTSANSLEELIRDLTEKIDTTFKEGVKKINDQFNDFFALMFGGGKASLVVVREKKRKRLALDLELLAGDAIPDEEEEGEEGVDIEVNLPHKKIKGLQMLSGGERALTSIALLFAMSQVNPPPFLVLDETDAALDEANSRKYGDMLENLSKYSQLVVVTHNRETMSRARVLYGITMGSDAVSKLLSVKFEEAAEQFAK